MKIEFDRSDGIARATILGQIFPSAVDLKEIASILELLALETDCDFGELSKAFGRGFNSVGEDE